MANNMPATKATSSDIDRYTGNKLKRTDPKRFAMIKRALGEGLGIRVTARIFGTSTSVVRAIRIRDKELGNPGTLKRALAGRMLTVVERALETLEDTDLLDKATAVQTSVVIGVLVDKMQVLAGEPTQIIQQKKDSLNSADLNTLLNKLPRAEARVIDVPDNTQSKPVACQAVC